jgi:hypothetical protein
MEKSILMRIVSSIPIVGTALALWLEHTQLGMAQYGSFWGLLRGLLVGLVIAITLLGLSEGAIAVFDVGREYINLHVTATPKTEIRTEIMADETKKIYESLMHPGNEVSASGLSFYVVKNTLASVYDGEGFSVTEALQVDLEAISRGWQRAGEGARIVPFFRYDETDEGGRVTHPEKTSVATVTSQDTKAEYVVAQLGGRLILIPLSDYQAAGLPLNGGR